MSGLDAGAGHPFPASLSLLVGGVVKLVRLTNGTIFDGEAVIAVNAVRSYLGPSIEITLVQDEVLKDVTIVCRDEAARTKLLDEIAAVLAVTAA